ncbi:MAG: UPF0182 family protein, partial [Armatimonadetes bacterium]|nr:UPF0182 family protein [Armatimonadota bacterium]
MPDEPIIEIIDLNEPEPYNIPWRRLTLFGGLFFACFLLFHNGVPLYIDSLWFHEVGYTSVFTRQIIAKSLLFFGMGGIAFALLYGNVLLARKMASPAPNTNRCLRIRGSMLGSPASDSIARVTEWTATTTMVEARSVMSNEWVNFLAYQNVTPFNVIDPVFHRDVGFYVFNVPFLEYLNNFLLITLLASTIVVVAVHSVTRAMESLAGLPNIEPRILKHLLVLGAGLAI